MKNFEEYHLILKNKEYSRIISAWKKHSFLGSEVKVKTLNSEYSGIAYDIDRDGFLVIKDEKGKKDIIREGDVLIK